MGREDRDPTDGAGPIQGGGGGGPAQSRRFGVKQVHLIREAFRAETMRKLGLGSTREKRQLCDRILEFDPLAG
jgi:hypothetical protein